MSGTDPAARVGHALLESLFVAYLNALDEALEVDDDITPDQRAALRAGTYHEMVRWYRTERARVDAWLLTWNDEPSAPVTGWLAACDESTIH